MCPLHHTYLPFQRWALKLCSVSFPSQSLQELIPLMIYHPHSLICLKPRLSSTINSQSIIQNHLVTPHLKFVYFNLRSSLPLFALSPPKFSIHMCSIFSFLNSLQSVLSPQHPASYNCSEATLVNKSNVCALPCNLVHWSDLETFHTLSPAS